MGAAGRRAYGKGAKGLTTPCCSLWSVLSTPGRCTSRGWNHSTICAAAVVVWLSRDGSATTRPCSWKATKALLQQPLLPLRRLRAGTGSSGCRLGLFPCRPMHEWALPAHPSRPGSGVSSCNGLVCAHCLLILLLLLLLCCRFRLIRNCAAVAQLQR